MCGISGIINKQELAVEAAEIKAMNNAISHRGPDGEGIWFGESFALGHRRLAIIDLGETGKQPMSYKDRLVITYNGEIYNYIELRDELKSKGYEFNSSSDTEVILAAYDCYGTDCVKRFNGMWAFALYDKLNGLIFCSRDRFGVKPFYYSDSGARFAFGSEIRQLLPFIPERKVNRSVMADYLIAGLDDCSDETFFSGIRKLPPSHSLVYDLRKNVYKITRYYSIRINDRIKGLTEADSAAEFRKVFEDAVKLRLRSDVKVGTCLSGGIDSSSVASLAAKHYSKDEGNRFSAITARSTEPQLDESSHAALVASESNLDWHTVTPVSGEFIRDIDEIIKIQEEPFGSPSVYMQYRVFREARERGCTVMLDGQGGDEILLGYERYYPAFLLSKGILKGTTGFLLSFMRSKLSAGGLFMYLLYFTIPGVRIRRLRNRFFFVRDSFFMSLNKGLLVENAMAYKDIGKLQQLEITKMQLPHLLKYEDRNSMSQSVEARLPFLDFRVLETALSVNDNYKIKDGWTKYLLRVSMKGSVPPSILWRKDKLGFNAPEKTWLGEMNDVMQETISRSKILEAVTYTDRLRGSFEKLDLRVKWRLFNIARWEELFDVAY
ncbi:MAG: asparagine synthase (glutamine-hydrolyzing) [Bacteroidales bacterium]|nr:asparagine synthase (glutamine-hydrolyzing) [Bacteroidales bacterium]